MSAVLSQAGLVTEPRAPGKSEPSKAEFSRTLGLNLQRLRMERGWSQERLAHMAGIAGYTYQKFEKGESKPGTPMNPRLFTLLSLAQVLGVSLEELVPATWPDLEDGS